MRSKTEIRGAFGKCTVLKNEDFNRLAALIYKAKESIIQIKIDALRDKRPGEFLVENFGAQKADEISKQEIEKERIKFSKEIDEILIYKVEYKNKIIKEALKNDCLIEKDNNKNNKIKQIDISYYDAEGNFRISYGGESFTQGFRFNVETFSDVADSIARSFNNFGSSITPIYSPLLSVPYQLISFISFITALIIFFALFLLKTSYDQHILHFLALAGESILLFSWGVSLLGTVIKYLFPKYIIATGDELRRLHRLQFLRWFLGLGGIGGILIAALVSKI